MSPSTSVSKLGMWGPVLCIVHCTIVPIAVPFIPLFGIMAHNEWVESLFWGLSLVVALLYAWNARGLSRYYFVVVAIVGTIGLLVHNHELLHAACYFIAVGVLYTLARKKQQDECKTHVH